MDLETKVPEPTPPTPPAPGGKKEDEPGKTPPAGTDENIVALQRKLSEKDVQLKTLQKELEARKQSSDDGEVAKTLAALREEMMVMSEELSVNRKEKTMKNLAEKYPDILPELLFGREEKEIESIVEKQRARNKEIFGDSRHFTEPSYSSAEQIQKEIDAVSSDKKLSGEQKALKVLQLRRLFNSVSK